MKNYERPVLSMSFYKSSQQIQNQQKQQSPFQLFLQSKSKLQSSFNNTPIIQDQYSLSKNYQKNHSFNYSNYSTIFNSPSPYLQMKKKAQIQRQNQYNYIKKQLLQNKMHKIDQVIDNFLPQTRKENKNNLSQQQIYENRKYYLKQVDKNLQALKKLTQQIDLDNSEVIQQSQCFYPNISKAQK